MLQVASRTKGSSSTRRIVRRRSRALATTPFTNSWAEESYRPPIRRCLTTLLQQSLCLVCLHKKGTVPVRTSLSCLDPHPRSSEDLRISERRENGLLRIQHNLAHAGRHGQTEPCFPAPSASTSPRKTTRYRCRRIHRNRRHQIVGRVLLYDHARNRGHSGSSRRCEFREFPALDCRSLIQPSRNQSNL